MRKIAFSAARMILQKRVAWWHCLLAACLLSGCGPSGSTATPPWVSKSDAPVSDEPAVAADSSVGAPATADQTRFSYFGEVDRRSIAKAFEESSRSEPAPLEKPAGMDDDVFQWIQLVSLPPLPTDPIFEVSATGEDLGDLPALSRDGRRLITSDRERIRIWDVDEGKEIAGFGSPEQLRRVSFLSDLDRVLVEADNWIGIYSLTGRNYTARWDGPEKVEWVCVADDDSVTAVVTRDLRMFALGPALEQLTEYSGDPLASPRIAIHPDGKHVLANTTSRPARWNIQSGEAELLHAEPYDPTKTSCVSGPAVDSWVGISWTTRYSGDQLQDGFPYHDTANAYQLNPFALDARLCQSGDRDWLLIDGQRPDASGEDVYVLFDFQPDRRSYSMPLEFQEPAISFSSSTDGARVAFRFADYVRVYDRRVWLDATGTETPHRVAELMLAGRFEQLEVAAELLRQMPVHRSGDTGERFYSELVMKLGKVWADVETRDGGSDRVKAIEQWYDRGSELALAASAVRHQAIGWNARGNGFAYTVPAEAWPILERRTNLAHRDLDRLLKGEKPPAVAFARKIFSMRDAGFQPLDAEPLLARCVQLYPLEEIAHDQMVVWLLPQWSDSAGSAGAYAAALSELYPAAQGDKLYAQLGLMTADYGTGLMTEACGFDAARVFNACERMMQNSELRQWFADYLIYEARRLYDVRMQKLVSEYYVERFPCATSNACRIGIDSEIFRTRLRLLTQ